MLTDCPRFFQVLTVNPSTDRSRSRFQPSLTRWPSNSNRWPLQFEFDPTSAKSKISSTTLIRNSPQTPTLSLLPPYTQQETDQPLKNAALVRGLHWLSNAEEPHPRRETASESEDMREQERLRVWMRVLTS